MTSLPAHQGILAENYIIRYAQDARRQQLEDGAVRRAPLLTRPVEYTDLTLLIGDTAAREAFAAWADAHAHEWFLMSLMQRRAEVRVVGGATGIAYRQRTTGHGVPLWAAALSVESRPLVVTPPAGELVWPDYVLVLADDELGIDGIVRRTTVAQGAPVRQGDPTGADLPRRYRLSVQLDNEHLAPFLNYCYAAANKPLWWPTGATNTYQRRRLYEGLGSLTVRQAARQAGDVQWVADLELEGYDGNTRIILPPDQPGTVTLSTNSPVRGTAIRASLSDPDGSINALTWQWQRGTTDIPGATSASYTPVRADVGRTLRAVASYNDGHSNGKTATSAPTSAVANTPDQPGTVTIDDTTPVRGTAIRAALTDADTPISSLTWQWQRGTANIPGATSARYTPVLADVGHTLRAIASYSDGHGHGKSATSAPTVAVANTTDQPGTVTISDTTPVRATAITATLSDPDGNLTGVTWQWRRGSTNIAGATSARYTPVLADVGETLRAVASYTDAHGVGKTASAQTEAVANTVDQPGEVLVDDTTPTVGATVTASLEDADTPLTNITWQWQRGTNDITGATSATYTPVDADVGHTLRAVAAYNDAQGTGKTATSAATSAVISIPDNVGTVTIDDTTPTRGTAITAKLSDADTPISSLTWQWQRGTTKIPGATSSSYTPVLADVGHTLRAIAAYNDAHGNGKTATSTATTAVANTVDVAGTVALDVTRPKLGAAVTAALSDADTPISSLTWQWQRNDDGWSDITDATAAAYTPVEADVGHTLRAVASYTDAHGTGKSATSAATAAVRGARTELSIALGTGTNISGFGAYWVNVPSNSIPAAWMAGGSAGRVQQVLIFDPDRLTLNVDKAFKDSVAEDMELTITSGSASFTTTMTDTSRPYEWNDSGAATFLAALSGGQPTANLTLSTGGL